MDNLPQSSPLTSGNLARNHASSLFAALDRVRPRGRADVPLILWESDRSFGGDITQGQADTIIDSVRRGGSLLLSFGANPQSKIMLLSQMLPAIPWAAAANWSTDYGPRPAIRVGTVEAEFFQGASLEGQPVPFFTALRPFAAVERGQAIYERYAQTISSINLKLDAHSQFWSRSLQNRQWKVRVTGDDVYASPLLITGVYGAGRVAVFASSAAATDTWQAAVPFWSGVLQWLNSSAAGKYSKESVTGSSITFKSMAKGLNTAEIAVANRGSSAVSGLLVTRALGADGALLGASEAESEAAVHIPPGGSKTVDVKLPTASPTGYRSLEANRAVRLRMGLLSESGADLLAETETTIRMVPPVVVSIHTDNLYAWRYPFDAAAPEDITALSTRMGNRMNAYCYPPGATVQCEVLVENGVTNIAPLATIIDETQSGNLSVMALNDGAAIQEKGPGDGIQGFGAWVGIVNRENVLRLSFAGPVRISAVTLIGCGSEFRLGLDHNPGSATIEADGRQVASFPSIDQNFLDGYGRARLEFTPVSATTLRIRLPWVPMRADRRRQVPWLGELEVETIAGLPISASGDLEIVLRDVLSGAAGTPIASERLQLTAGGRHRLAKAFVLPQASNGASTTRFFAVEASFAGTQTQTSLVTISPTHPIRSRRKLLPADAPSISQLVTHGFRNCFALGTGTAEINIPWGSPDDLIWAYSRQLKQETHSAATEANRLYATASDMRHYSTPWAVFPNGDDFYGVATPGLVQQMSNQKNWATSEVAILYHSDRWDSGPQMSGMHQWQEYVEFDRHLRSTGGAGLLARTKTALADEIHTQHEAEWQQWHLDRYVQNIQTLRQAFQSAGKQLVLSAQGIPLVAGPAGAKLAETIQGAADDSTWGMANSSVPLTTGRQMGEIAFNPVWKLSTLLEYGFNTNLLNSPQWHAPVGTLEPSRRHCYNRAWRATVWPDGRYGSVYTYGYSENVGVAYTLSEDDWQQWWRLQQRQTLIAPESPVGAGLVIATSFRASGSQMQFSGGGETGGEGAEVKLIAQTFLRLHEAGVSLPFAANISALRNWAGSAPLIVLNLWQFSDAEVATLSRLQAQGTRIAAFQSPQPLSSAANALTQRPGVSLLPLQASQLTPDSAAKIAAGLHQSLDLQIQFAPGTAGYGFRSGGITYIVVEDWQEQGREIQIQVKSSRSTGPASACDVNEHRPLSITRQGAWWRIDLPIRPGDGTLIAIEER